MVEYKDRLARAMKQAPALAAVPERSRIQRLADVLALSYQGVKKVLDGKSRAFNALNNARIAAFLEVDASWLATGLGQMAPRVHMTGPEAANSGAKWLTTGSGHAPPPHVAERGAADDSAQRPVAQDKLTDVFEDWRLHASPLSLEVIEGLSLLAQKNALREEDWQVIKALMLRFGRP